MSTNIEAMAACRTVEIEEKMAGSDDRLQGTLYLPSEGAPKGVLVWIHGGGWISGSVAEDDNLLRALCAECSLGVFGVEYSLAPAHPFPVALKQCCAAVSWVRQATQIYGWPSGMISVGGESAGGGVAAGVALRLRDIGDRPLLGQVLVCPALTSVTDRERFESAHQYAYGYGNDTSLRQVHWDAYTDGGLHATNTYVTPLLTTSFAHLPPAAIVTAEKDPIRDEAEEFARRITESGTACSLKRFANETHGASFSDPASMSDADGSFTFVTNVINTWLNRQDAP